MTLRWVRMLDVLVIQAGRDTLAEADRLNQAGIDHVMVHGQRSR
jgi:hypothetical protein